MKRTSAGARPHRAVVRDRAHLEPVRAAGQPREDDGTLVRGRAPVAVDALQAVLVAQFSARREVDAAEVDLERRGLATRVRERHEGLAERRQRLTDAVQRDARDPDGRWGLRILARGLESRETLPGAEPEVAVPVAEAGLDDSGSEPVVGGEVLDVPGRRVDPVEPALRADVDAAPTVLGERSGVLAREAERHEPRLRIGRRVDAGDAPPARRDPEPPGRVEVKRPHRSCGETVSFREEVSCGRRGVARGRPAGSRSRPPRFRPPRTTAAAPWECRRPR